MAGEITFIGGAFLRTASQYTPGSPARLVGGVLSALLPRSGALRIAGTLKLVGPPLTPAQRRVVLLERDSLRVVRGVYSDENGDYSFEKLGGYEANYIVLGVDQTGVYNADVADNIAAGA